MGSVSGVNLSDRKSQYYAGAKAAVPFVLATLVLGGVLARHPELDVCLSHGGGSTSWLLERLRTVQLLDTVVGKMSGVISGCRCRPSRVATTAAKNQNLECLIPGKAARVGKGALVAQNIDEDPVTALVMEAVDRLLEDRVVVDRGLFVALEFQQRGSTVAERFEVERFGEAVGERLQHQRPSLGGVAWASPSSIATFFWMEMTNWALSSSD